MEIECRYRGVSVEHGDEGGSGRGTKGGELWAAVRRKHEFKERRFTIATEWGTLLMYMSTASLFHLPSSLILSFDKPFAFVVTAAPFRSEWPENPSVEIPAWSKYSWTLSMEYRFEKGPKFLHPIGAIQNADQKRRQLFAGQPINMSIGTGP